MRRFVLWTVHLLEVGVDGAKGGAAAGEALFVGANHFLESNELDA